VSLAIHLKNAKAVVHDFGGRVRARRLAAGMSQAELGRSSRVTPKFISEIERGASNPSLMTMVLVADALGCGVSELLQPDKPIMSSALSLRVDDARRAREAVAVLASVLLPRKRARRALAIRR
jgi:transcriptional regulator with XRE-family HTH domain